MANAFEYAQNSSLMLEADYPYVGLSSGECMQQDAKGKVKVSRYINVVPNDPMQLKIAVSMGPVSAAVATTDPVFRHYSGGIITSETCGSMVDCAVTIVGYGQEQGQEYWLVKNSWGTSWGENGYAKIAVADGQGICGINTQPSIPFTA